MTDQDWLEKLVADSSYSRDSDRAKVLATYCGINVRAAKTRISRFRKSHILHSLPRVVEVGPFWVYCIECILPGHFYVGQTGSIAHRINQHRNGCGARATAKYGVKNYMAICRCPTREMALRVESLLYRVLIKKGVLAHM